MRAFLGLGSNVGDREANIRAAVDRLPVVRVSSLYDTAPQGEVLDQPDFLNAVAEIDTDLEPEDLLDLCKGIERDLGRESGVRHGPRPIDIDILLIGDIAYVSDRLRVPHPDLRDRRFVLEPLHELDPELVDDAELEAVAGQRVRRVSGP